MGIGFYMLKLNFYFNLIIYITYVCLENIYIMYRADKLV